MAEFAQNFFPITRVMTFGAMITEVSCPVLCFLAPYDQYTYDEERRMYVRTFKSWRYIPALALSFFHLTLWATIRIPALQIICASVPVVWIPGSFWDDIGWHWGIKNMSGNHPNRLVPDHPPHPVSPMKWLRNGKTLVRTIVLGIAIPGMLMNYGFRMEWLDASETESGVVGLLSNTMDALFLFQEWRIFKDAPRLTMAVLFVGYYDGAEEKDPRKDILAVFRTNDWSNRTDMSFETYAQWSAEMNVNMSAQFGHWRIESFITEPDGLQAHHDKYYETEDWFRFDLLQSFICKWGNNELAKANDPRRLKELEMVLQMAKVLSPLREERFRRTKDIVYSFSCEEEPEEVEPGKLSYPKSERQMYPPFVPSLLED